MSTIAQPALPPYSVRVSSRARHIRLTVTAREGLVVVVPRGMRINADEIVSSKRTWALRALASIADQRALHAAGPDALLPHEITLPALGESWPVDYRGATGSTVRARPIGSQLVVSGAIDDGDACLHALNGWIHRVARTHLPERLAQLAHEHGLVYSAVRVGRQRSRWGSCSSRGTISLNRNLVFFEPHLVDALLLHELAHTRALNHSPGFWRILTELDPRAHEHRVALKNAGRLVPAWADA